MAGPNLEIFRFGFYMFFPIYIMFKFGDPVWYDTYVVPYKEMFWPPYETTHQTPKTQTDLREELARMKADRIARKSAIQNHPTISSTSTSTSFSSEFEDSDSLPIPTPTPAPTPTATSTSTNVGIGSSSSGWKWPTTGGNSTSTSASSGRLV